MSEWKTIDSAPKDDIFILGYCPHDNIYEDMPNIFVICVNPYTDEWYVQTPEGDETAVTPTHWMPLPDAPK